MDIIDGTGLWSVTSRGGGVAPSISPTTGGRGGVVIFASNADDLRREMLAQNIAEEEILLILSLMEF